MGAKLRNFLFATWTESECASWILKCPDIHIVLKCEVAHFLVACRPDALSHGGPIITASKCELY